MDHQIPIALDGGRCTPTLHWHWLAKALGKRYLSTNAMVKMDQPAEGRYPK